jgi:hypothetical protein
MLAAWQRFFGNVSFTSVEDWDHEDCEDFGFGCGCCCCLLQRFVRVRPSSSQVLWRLLRDQLLLDRRMQLGLLQQVVCLEWIPHNRTEGGAVKFDR